MAPLLTTWAQAQGLQTKAKTTGSPSDMRQKYYKCHKWSSHHFLWWVLWGMDTLSVCQAIKSSFWPKPFLLSDYCLDSQRKLSTLKAAIAIEPRTSGSQESNRKFSTESLITTNMALASSTASNQAAISWSNSWNTQWHASSCTSNNKALILKSNTFASLTRSSVL